MTKRARDPMREAEREAEQCHAVRFYEDSASLTRIAAGFLSEGLVNGAPALIIATPEHRRGILEGLASSVDVERVMARGDLTVLDVHEALATFLVDGMPAAQLFWDTILPMIDRITEGRRECVVKAYGEMADVLWKQGREAAALRLENLGAQLTTIRNVSILCGYSMSNLYPDVSFGRICREHTHVVSANGVPTSIGPGGLV